MKKVIVITLGIIIVSFIISIYLYPKMPEKMAGHWNEKGQVDGYIPRFWGLFLMPIVSLAMFLLFILIPKIDPLRENISKFRKYFDLFVLLIISFLFYLYLLTIFWNLGSRFNMVLALIPALGIIFYYCGILIESAKRNWFIGIRTPWTLSNENVWNKTHKIGGKLFKLSGVVAIFGLLFQNYAIFLALIPIILSSIYTFFYSYFEYKKEIKI